MPFALLSLWNLISHFINNYSHNGSFLRNSVFQSHRNEIDFKLVLVMKQMLVFLQIHDTKALILDMIPSGVGVLGRNSVFKRSQGYSFHDSINTLVKQESQPTEQSALFRHRWAQQGASHKEDLHSHKQNSGFISISPVFRSEKHNCLLINAWGKQPQKNSSIKIKTTGKREIKHSFWKY